MNYLVMETHQSYCVVLDEAGRFIKAANFGYAIGQSVDTIYELQAEPPRIIPWKPILSFASAAAAVFILFMALQFFRGFGIPYASVYLQINPEVRIDVRRDDTVVAVHPMNEDGAALLEGYEAGRKDLDIVTDELIERAIAMGYLSAGGGVTIRLDAPDDLWFQDTGVRLRRNLSERLSVTIEITRYETTSPEEPPQSITIPFGGDSDFDGDSDYDSPHRAPMPAEDDSDFDSDYDDESDYRAPSIRPMEDSDYDDGDSSDFDGDSYDDDSPYDDD